MIKLIDLTFYANEEFDDPVELVVSQQHSYGYICFIKNKLNIKVVKHFVRDAKVWVNGVPYTLFRGINKPGYISFKTLRHLAAEKADIILVQGLGFPVQVLMLRLWMGKKTTIIAQHHAERPMKRIGRLLQKMADKYIQGYLFTVWDNAEEWYALKIIRDKHKYHELLELSTSFTPKNKQEARQAKGIKEGDIFLWVGRLEANKDPMTVLRGFASYLPNNPNAFLYMAYQETNLLTEVQSLIDEHPLLKKHVYLLGKIPHSDLQDWFSAADFYLSGSHREGSGTALVEAMACGCIPVVTNIPSFNKIAGNGRFGFLYEASNPASLLAVLNNLPTTGRSQLSAAIVTYFEEQLSLKAIANGLFNICNTLKQ